MQQKRVNNTGQICFFGLFSRRIGRKEKKYNNLNDYSDNHQEIWCKRGRNHFSTFFQR